MTITGIRAGGFRGEASATSRPLSAPARLSRWASAPGGTWALALTVVLLALWTVYLQEQELGLAFLRTHEVADHRAVLENTAPNPWQYRVGSIWLLEALFSAAARAGVPDHAVVVMLGVRLAQNAAIFLLAAAYYTRLGLDRRAVVLGLGVLAWSMSFMLCNSGLSFNTYFDAIFYLAGALAITRANYTALVALMPFAALNRETSALLPVMLLCHTALAARSWRAALQGVVFRTAALMTAIWLVAFVGTRVYFGLRPWANWGLPAAGVPMLLSNLRDPITWRFVAGTFGVLPIVALLGARHVQLPVRAFALALVPVWLLLHFVTVPANETRIFLVPVAVVLVPAALLAVVGTGHPTRPTGRTS